MVWWGVVKENVLVRGGVRKEYSFRWFVFFSGLKSYSVGIECVCVCVCMWSRVCGWAVIFEFQVEL